MEDYLETPQYGGFHVGGGNYSQNTTLTLNDDGVAYVMFRMGMQPGNNYRVAAALVGDEGDFASLQVANPGASFYVPSGDGQVSFGGIGALSPMLTVWRKLHLEFDAMEAPNPTNPDHKNYVEGTVLARTVEGDTVTLTFAPFGGYSEDYFINGRMEIQDYPAFETNHLPKYKVLSYSPGSVSMGIVVNATVTVSQDPGAGVVGKTFKLFDDDDVFLDFLGIPRPFAQPPDGEQIINAIQGAFSPGYILLKKASSSLNTHPTIPFALNQASVIVDGVSDFDDAKDLTDSPGFWAHTIVFGYQPLSIWDHDPDEGVLDGLLVKGITVEKTLLFENGYSAIFLEPIREEALATMIDSTPITLINPSVMAINREKYYQTLFGVIAHEIMHPPGGNDEDDDHAEQALMREGAGLMEPPEGSSFSALTFRRMREAKKWNETTSWWLP